MHLRLFFETLRILDLTIVELIVEFSLNFQLNLHFKLHIRIKELASKVRQKKKHLVVNIQHTHSVVTPLLKKEVK